MQDEQATEPFRFTAEKTTDVFDVLKEMGGIRHDALYVRLIRQPDGLAIGRTAMRQLPASRRQILLGGGRSNITPFVSSTVKIIPTDRVMAGSAEFQLTIETKTKVEGAGGAAAPAAPRVARRSSPRSRTRQGPPLRADGEGAEGEGKGGGLNRSRARANAAAAAKMRAEDAKGRDSFEFGDQRDPSPCTQGRGRG